MFTRSQAYIDHLLEDDCPYMDLTVEALGIGDAPGRMDCHPKAACVLAGVEEAVALLRTTGCTVGCHARSGHHADAGETFLTARGTARALHRGWKIAQTVLEYASGIATRTALMCANARSTSDHAHVAVTRKNFPGAKRLSLAAAMAGGGIIHRLGLSDSMLVFDQHTVFMQGLPGFIRQLENIRRVFPERKLCVEVSSLDDALLLASSGVDSIQCERFSCADLAAAVRGIKSVNPRTVVLAAGGVNADNAAAVAQTGVDVLVTSWVYFGKPQDIKCVFTAVQEDALGSVRK